MRRLKPCWSCRLGRNHSWDNLSNLMVCAQGKWYPGKISVGKPIVQDSGWYPVPPPSPPRKSNISASLRNTSELLVIWHSIAVFNYLYWCEQQVALSWLPKHCTCCWTCPGRLTDTWDGVAGGHSPWHAGGHVLTASSCSLSSVHSRREGELESSPFLKMTQVLLGWAPSLRTPCNL